MSHPKFAVSRFKNRNGVVSFRVDGRLHGVRIRTNFKTREEAIAEKAVLDLKVLQSEAGLRPATTFLSADQLREAESVFRGLDGRSLTFLTDYARAMNQAVKQQYWIIQNQQHASDSPRYVPVQIPAQKIDGVVTNPTIHYIKIDP